MRAAARAVLGAYPNARFVFKRSELTDFVTNVGRSDGEASYRELRTRYGMLRSNERFWAFSDEMNAAHRRSSPIEHGLFDYNRLEAY